VLVDLLAEFLTDLVAVDVREADIEENKGRWVCARSLERLFAGGCFDPVSFTDDGLTLSATVSYAGLGNFDTLQVLTATGGTVSTCTNQGGNEAPGQNPAPISLVGETPIPAGDIKNGNVTIKTTTAAPVSPVPGAPGCPNSNWTEVINDVSFTSATIMLFQDTNADGDFDDAGELVLTVSCSFSPSTSNGAVPRAT
jgi:hypothetical protein